MDPKPSSLVQVLGANRRLLGKTGSLLRRGSEAVGEGSWADADGAHPRHSEDSNLPLPVSKRGRLCRPLNPPGLPPQALYLCQAQGQIGARHPFALPLRPRLRIPPL